MPAPGPGPDASRAGELRLPVVLASASPRRRDLLHGAGVEFEVLPADVDEDLSDFVDPGAAVLELATRKAQAIAYGRSDEGLVLGSDTVVAVQEGEGWRLLGKPEDEREARSMLEGLSNTRHQVLTGVCVLRTPDWARAEDLERTWVSMRAILPEEVEAYVASGEWRGKAGGYAIQETADRFVTGLEGGGFDNVVGLPVALTLQLLLEAQGAEPQGD